MTLRYLFPLKSLIGVLRICKKWVAFGLGVGSSGRATHSNSNIVLSIVLIYGIYQTLSY